MSVTASGRTWDEASSPAAAQLAWQYELAWREPGRPRPEPADFLPLDPAERPGALLALLRADLNLRFEAGESVRVERYRHYDLDNEVLVGLLYEEYRRRKDADRRPDPAEYDARFPEVAAQLRRIIEFDSLFHGWGEPTAPSTPPDPSDVPLPEAGQTIGGFRLVEELGRGTFARVFRAEERQLADRPVALKVSRRGSREPQTLARLQHTHIVPVHSYRIDPFKGLHLLCMPYFGRVTLAQILAEPEIQAGRSGAQLVAALDRLEPSREAADRTAAGRKALAGRPFARAIAWWGARLAEALQHAHDRGVLHRDIKPSNVLVTADGLPMLLDFNLAQEKLVDAVEGEPATLGGTVAYMAPEHLEALADGNGERVDTRADLYSLGVVLFEALAGRRPFDTPRIGQTMHDTLRRLAHQRRAQVPSVREARPEVPPALDAVVRRCMAPDPAARYAAAAELAADLQAVADDGPLWHAREPQPSRLLRWLRRNRLRFAVAAPVALALIVLVATALKFHDDWIRREAEIGRLLDEGKAKYVNDELIEAKALFDFAAQRAQESPVFEDLYRQAREQIAYTADTKRIRDQADALFDEAHDLRFCLLGFNGDRPTVFAQARRALDRFYVLRNPGWATLSDLTLLDAPRRLRLRDEVNELLFLWALALEDPRRPDDPAAARDAVKLCDRALLTSRPTGPWEALRVRYAAKLGAPPPPATVDRPALEATAQACYQWGLLREREHRTADAIAWLERAAQLDPRNYWAHFYLAYCHERVGQVDRALQHADVAVALWPTSPWARFNRARLSRLRGAWDSSLADLEQVQTLYRKQQAGAASGQDFLAARLELGFVLQALGDVPGAREAYRRVIAAGQGTPYPRAARINLAKLEADVGLGARARTAYDDLLTEDPKDAVARRGRAMLALRRGQAGRAAADLDVLLKDGPRTAELLALCALARLSLGCPGAAAADAAEAVRLDPRPAHRRLWARVRLASGDVAGLRLDHPDDLAALPARGPALAADLRRAADQLGTAAAAAAAPARLTRAVLLSALNDPAAADEAGEVVAAHPASVQALLVRARILRRAGDWRGALDDVRTGLDLDAADPRLWELRGILLVEGGQTRAGLDDLDSALRLGAEGPSIRRARARALSALGRDAEARADWTRALAHDPEDPVAYLGRARTCRRLGQTDQALADLEQAAGWADDRAELLAAAALGCASCLPARPGHLPRVASLVLRTGAVALGTVPPFDPARRSSPGPEDSPKPAPASVSARSAAVP